MNQLTWGEVNRWMDGWMNEWNERRRDGPKEEKNEEGRG